MKAIFIDDEPFALDLLKKYSLNCSLITSCGFFSNPIKAFEFLQTNKIDLIFLDINMPEITGFELLSSLNQNYLVVFTTAYNEYAVKSYDVNAVDYLLKPITYDKFLRAIEKAIKIFNINKAHQEQREMVSKEQVLNIKSGGQNHLIRTNDIKYIEASGNYVIYNTVQKKIIAQQTIKQVEEMLPTEYFSRVHKSFIISLLSVESYDKEQVIVSGKAIPLGLAYRESFFNKILMIK